MSKVPVYIRVDGSSKIGLGHIYRCIALAQMITSICNVTFYVKQIPSSLMERLKENFGFDAVQIEGEQDFFKEIGNESEPAVVVLDGYQFGTSYQSELKTAGVAVVCIDDIYEQHFVADAVINHGPGIPIEDYSVESYTKLFLGTSYALLREEFIKLISQPAKTQQLETVFVCFGGADPGRYTLKTLKVLEESSMVAKAIIITGSGFSEKQTIESFHDVNKLTVEHYHDIGDAHMARLMEQSDFAIVPSSTILYEVSAARLPAITGYFVKNQTRIYLGFTATGAVLGIGELSPPALKKGISNLTIAKCREMQAKQGEIIDGRSPERIRNIFNKLV